MPNRILKESICRSDSIDSLTWFEEVLFYRLIVVCDDFGRFDGRPAIIKGTCFPLKDVTNKTISDALKKLSTVGLIRGYEVQGRPYLQLVTWENHQQVRAKKSKYPACDNGCMQVISDDITCTRNPIQSESNPNPNTNTIARAGSTRFCDFIKAYPKHGADAYIVSVEYMNMIQMGISEDDLVKAAENYAETCRINRTDAKYILNAENFLKKMSFESYMPGKYKPPAPRKKNSTEQYNTYMRSDYDLIALEKELLGGGRNEQNPS